MPVNPPVNLNPQNFSARDIIVDAFIEVGIIAPGEEDNMDGGVAQWGLRKLNYALDKWSALRRAVYASTFQTFNLVAGLSPHTIGPNNATFAANQRPVRIESWALVLNQSPVAVNLPRRPVRDKDWWAVQRVPTLQSNIPTDLYYEPDSPNGSLFFWPVPNTVYPVSLELWTLLSQYSSITDPVGGPGGPGTLPPAYRAALMYSLAEELQPGAGKEVNPQLARLAAEARAAAFGNNSTSPRMSTRDSGMPRSLGKGADFNWETGNEA